MVVEYDTSEELFLVALNCQRDLMRRVARITKREKAIGVVLWVVVMFLAIALIDLYGRLNSYNLILLNWVLGCFFALVVLTIWLNKIEGRAAYDDLIERKRRFFPEKVTLTVSDAGVAFESARGFLRLSWGQVEDVRELGDNLAIIFVNYDVQVVPKKVFRDECVCREFVAFAKGRIGP